MKIEPNITIISGKDPGPTVTIMGGVHGDELVGVKTLEYLVPKLELKRGTLIAVVANPAAINEKKRFIDHNLNRVLVADPPEKSNEGRLARFLMDILDKSDALLDIHAGMGGEPPFIICEENSFSIAKCMPVSIVSTGWVEAEPGSTDEYMYRQGKSALCIECGDKNNWQEMIPLAVDAIQQFLGYWDMIDSPPKPNILPQKIVAVRYPVFKDSEAFVFVRKFIGFENLKPNELIATDREKNYFAPTYPSCIIFPWQDTPVGTEAFLIAESL